MAVALRSGWQGKGQHSMRGEEVDWIKLMRVSLVELEKKSRYYNAV